MPTTPTTTPSTPVVPPVPPVPSPPVPARRPSGVRRPVPPPPTGVRWDPGARYRPAQQRPKVASGPVLVEERTVLAGRLRRAPAPRPPVFDRPLWSPGAHRAERADRARAVVVLDAVARYRDGDLDTAGLRRAVSLALRP